MSYKRVNKATARKLFNNGITITMLPCKVSSVALHTDGNAWVKPVEILTTQLESQYNKFDRAVNEFEYYNCNSELGYYSHFYVSEEDLEAHEMCKAMCN